MIALSHRQFSRFLRLLVGARVFAYSRPGYGQSDPTTEPRDASHSVEDLRGLPIPADTVKSLPPVQIAEFEGFASASEEIHAAGTFGPYPVRVLTATEHSFEPNVEALWVSMLGSLVDEAKDGDQIMFKGAGHLIQVERPHDVAQVILSVVAAQGK